MEPTQPRRETIIQLQMDRFISDYAQQRRRQRWCSSCRDCAPAGGLQETVTRCCNFARFSLVCCAGAFNSMAPWALAAAEAITVLLIYFTMLPDALFTHVRLADYHYHFETSCEDLVVLSLLRSVVVLAAYLAGAGPQYQRPYLYAANVAGMLSLPFALMKCALLRHSGLPRSEWPGHIAIAATHGGYSLAHMVAAQRVVSWARKRYEMGLLGFGFPWEEGEQTWLLAGQLGSAGLQDSADAEAQAGAVQHDVPPEQLADEDSHFLDDCQGLRVHYKLALPQGVVEPGEAAVLLIHGFGGGTFSWRHLMQPLADACGMAVVAFDRPGFGLTSRPEVPPKTPLEDNPYSLKSQAVLTLKVAWQLGLKRVLLVGHEDGALLALMASAMACQEEQRFSFSPGSEGDLLRSPFAAVPTVIPSSSRVNPTRASSLPLGSSIPQSMDAAWAGSLRSGLESLGTNNFLRRLLQGDFSPSPTKSGPLLGGGGGGLPSGLGPAPWSRTGQRQRQGQQRLGRFPFGSDAGQEDGGRGMWWAHPVYAVQEEEEYPVLPKSTDTSPPHSVASHASSLRHCRQTEAAGGWPGQQLAPLQVPPPPPPQRKPSGDSSRLPAHWVAAAARDGAAAAAGPGAAPHIAPVQQQMGSLEKAGAAVGSSGAGEAAVQAAVGAVPQAQSQQCRVGEAVAGEEELVCSPLSPASQQQQQQFRGPGELEGQDEPGWHAPGWQLPLAVGLVLLHPDLSGQVAPRYTRVLGNSRLGRHVLRTLLRTEVGEASNRRAWADDSHLTPELLQLYKRPLQVVDWDKALIEVCRTNNRVHSEERARLLGLIAASSLPVLVMTGEHDHITTPAAAALLSERLPGSRLAVLPGCGHLSHEERPATLLDFLAAFFRDVSDSPSRTA